MVVGKPYASFILRSVQISLQSALGWVWVYQNISKLILDSENIFDIGIHWVSLCLMSHGTPLGRIPSTTQEDARPARYTLSSWQASPGRTPNHQELILVG
jgi:hypothetical protein